MKAADVIIRVLEEEGIEYVFGFPGGSIDEINTALFNSSKVKSIVPKREEGAAYMADGYARVSGKTGVCCSTAGPGAANLITAIATSYVDGIPVCALTGQVPLSLFGKGAYHESGTEKINLVSIFHNITKFSSMLASEERTQYLIEKAIRMARSIPSGPVHLSLPGDVMGKEAPAMSPTNPKFEERLFDRIGVKSAAELLVSAKRPAIIAGWGVVLSRGDKELLALAELLDIPVATSPKAKGIFPETHPLALGIVGFAGSPVSERYIIREDIDVLLAVGLSFNEFTTGGWDERLPPTKNLIHIDIDAEKIGKNYLTEVGVAGDARTVLNELIYAVKREISSADDNKKPVQKLDERRANTRSEVKAIKTELASADKPPERGEALYNPHNLILDIQEFFPKDTVFFAEIGNIMAWTIRYMVIEKPYSFFVSIGFGGMGYATAAAVGAKLAVKDQPVVVMAGDGGFLMTGCEVATAVNYNIPVIWIVFNNAMYGMIYHGRKMFGNVPEGIPSRFKRVDYVKVAEGLGARGIKIEKPEQFTSDLVQDILAQGRPTLLDVWIDEEMVPPIARRIASMEKHFA
ncbi:MAG: thiamine pyrophosphate-binding protein [Desulfobacterales bacterium]|nr:thiamine pyrophosphate-binding protein [Desulfobacterales bacterium]